MITDLKKQLFEQYPHKTELHAHTYPISPCSEFSPEALIEAYRETGVEAIALTNHLTPSHLADRSPDDFASEYVAAFERFRECAEAVGIAAIFGIELRFAENSNDYLVIGVDEAFLRETVTRLDMGIDAFYREYHRDSLLILQAHPFRNGMTPVDPASLDGFESMNLHPHHNSRVSVASSYQREQNFPVVTIGSDLHHWGHEGHSATRTKVLPEDETALVALLRSRDYLFEIGGAVMFPYACFDR